MLQRAGVYIEIVARRPGMMCEIFKKRRCAGNLHLAYTIRRSGASIGAMLMGVTSSSVILQEFISRKETADAWLRASESVKLRTYFSF